MLKEELRTLYLEKRLSLSDSDYKKKQKHLTYSLLEIIKNKKPVTVNVFLPIVSKKEFDCTFLIQELEKLNITVCIPVTNFKTKKMLFAEYTTGTRLVQKKYGIIEPKTPLYPIDHTKSITIVPLLVTDQHRNRIGYGGGFYDRYFQSNPNTYKIGVSFFPAIELIRDNTTHDIPLNDIVYP